MSLVDLVVGWLGPILAIVYVLGYSLIFEPIRKWKRLPAILVALLDCPMCIGFWAGVLVGIMHWLPVEWPVWLKNMALGGCIGIAVEYLLELVGRT